MTYGGAVVDELLSSAVVTHLGKGRSPFPVNDDEAVRELAGSESADLLPRVRNLEDEMMAVPIDWSSTSLSDGGDEARRALAERHPELSDGALDALRWMFTYNWR